MCHMLTGEGRSKSPGGLFLHMQMVFVAYARVQVKHTGWQCLA